MPSKRIKMRQEKQKKRGGEKEKCKSQDCCVTFCTFLNFVSQYFTSGSEGRKMYDL